MRLGPGRTVKSTFTDGHPGLVLVIGFSRRASGCGRSAAIVRAGSRVSGCWPRPRFPTP